MVSCQKQNRLWYCDRNSCCFVILAQHKRETTLYVAHIVRVPFSPQEVWNFVNVHLIGLPTTYTITQPKSVVGETTAVSLDTRAHHHSECLLYTPLNILSERSRPIFNVTRKTCCEVADGVVVDIQIHSSILHVVVWAHVDVL